jgi:hypothetical protein
VLFVANALKDLQNTLKKYVAFARDSAEHHLFEILMDYVSEMSSFVPSICGATEFGMLSL